MGKQHISSKASSLFLSMLVIPATSWTTTNLPKTKSATTTTRTQPLFSTTPFELDFYDDSGNPYSLDQSSLACPPDTKLVLGLNKYSHDTSLCAADATTGDVLFAVSKERLSRKKHDAGNVASMVETCLSCLNLDYDAIQKVVMNNHHHRILPLEEHQGHMEWESGLGINGGVEAGYEEEENTLPDAERVRMSVKTSTMGVQIEQYIVPVCAHFYDCLFYAAGIVASFGACLFDGHTKSFW